MPIRHDFQNSPVRAGAHKTFPTDPASVVSCLMATDQLVVPLHLWQKNQEIQSGDESPHSIIQIVAASPPYTGSLTRFCQYAICSATGAFPPEP